MEPGKSLVVYLRLKAMKDAVVEDPMINKLLKVRIMELLGAIEKQPCTYIIGEINFGGWFWVYDHKSTFQDYNAITVNWCVDKTQEEYYELCDNKILGNPTLSRETKRKAVVRGDLDNVLAKFKEALEKRMQYYKKTST